MAAATSPATGQAYGVKRVCAIWGVARSSFYDARRQEGRPQQSPAGRRGPKPRHSDEDLLAAIRHDLARSPWAGEGHRKVWARLRVIDGIRVGRSRVLRIMGENSLLSPHRRPPRPANDHDGSITTEAPNVMWGADGAVIPTVKDGNVTLFVVAGAGARRQPGLRLRPRRCRARGVVAPRPRQSLHVRALPEPAEVLRHGAQLRLRSRARDQRRRRAIHPYAEGADRLRTHLPGHRRRSAPPSGPTSVATISTGCWKRTATEARPRPGGTGWPQQSQPTRLPNDVLCPKNRVQYKSANAQNAAEIMQNLCTAPDHQRRWHFCR